MSRVPRNANSLRPLWCLVALLVVCSLAAPRRALAAGEPASGFPVDAYGALGDGATDDTAAVQAAIDAAAKAGGGTVGFRGGATYLVRSVNLMPGITLDGNGATVKRPAKTPGRFTRMFTTQNHPWVADADSPPLVVRDLTLDGNRQEQGPYLNYELEHAALLFLIGAEGEAAKKGRLRAVVQNCTFKDSPADGPHVYTNVAAQFSDCTSIDCFRGGLTVTGGHTVVQVSNFVGRGDTHRSGLQFEVDGAGFGKSGVTETTVNGMVIDGDFDCGLAPGSTFIASNVICRRPVLHVYAPGSRVMISDSTFAVGVQDGYVNRLVHPGDVTFRNCRFTVTESAEATEADRKLAGLSIFWNISGTAHTGMRVRLLDCVFDADATVEAADTTYAVYTTPDAAANDNRLTVRGGEVSAAYDYGVHMTQGGRVHLQGTRIEAATGVYWGVSAGFNAEMEVDAVVTTGATAMHVGSSGADSTLTHRNVEVDEATAALTTTYGLAANIYRGGRVVHVDSGPSGRVAGLVGDRARLKAPVGGQVCEWICTATGLPATAVWKSVAAPAE